MLRDEGSVGDFLGIRIEKSTNDTFNLSQTGLIEKVIKASGMKDCNTAVTPASTDPLGTDKSGEHYNESWEYPEIVGMLMFLATNSRPDIAYAVNQCRGISFGQGVTIKFLDTDTAHRSSTMSASLS